MADQESQLFTLPSWYHNLQQPEQTLEKLSVQLDLLPLRRIALSTRHSPFAQSLCGSQRRRFLFRDCISYAIDESYEEGKVDGAGDAGAVS